MNSKSNDDILLNSFCIFDKNIVGKCFKGIVTCKHVADKAISISYIGGNQQALDATKFLDELVVSVKMSCSVCGIDFKTRHEQVIHYKLQWHCNNLKRKIEGKTAMDEESFNESLKDETEPDSADSSFEEDEEDPNQIVEIKLDSKHLEKIFFQNESGYLFSVYKCIVMSKQDDPSGSSDFCDRIEQLPNRVNWAVILLGGGHFAAAIFKGQEVVAHKTFHRYTVRSKQGSSQSSHDRSKHASSGGASLRRYNETALIEEVQTLLKTWNSTLEVCNFVFYRAAGTNRSILMGGKQPLFAKDDQRLRTIPFLTAKPTFREVVRIHRKLSTVECYGNKIADEIAQLNSESEVSSQRKVKPNAKDTEIALDNREKTTQGSNTKQTKRRVKKRGKQHQEMHEDGQETSEDEEEVVIETNEEEINLAELREFHVTPNIRKRSKAKEEKPKSEIKDHKEESFKKTYDRLYTACKLGQLEPIQKTLNLAKDCNFENKKFGKLNSTLIHIASEGGFAHLVAFLLDAGANPTLKDAMGRPPYSVASNKETRNAFRRFMANYPEKYDYHLAQIPSPLSEEAERVKAEQRRQKTKEKKTEVKEKSDFLKLTQTEKKAAFTSGTVRCWLCGNPLRGKIPFEYNDYKFCTIGCLKDHRSKNKT